MKYAIISDRYKKSDKKSDKKNDKKNREDLKIPGRINKYKQMDTSELWVLFVLSECVGRCC